ncbi:MAG: lysine--tRNA ligase [Candidatus Kerfeldbacteria bacterium]|nr:lysine--tRNA ligase [Candidatus Kerfeldbacteria bacterium]
MTEPHSERSVRIAKAQAYQANIGPTYPSDSHRSHTVGQVLHRFSELTTTTVVLAGRIRQWREHGKLIFAHLEDATGRMQIALTQTDLKQPTYKELSYFDVADIVEVTGKPFTTQKGERSILVERIVMLTKAVQPLPDEWFGLQDEEQRYRQRYVDMLLNPELRAMFLKKTTFWNSIRQFLLSAGFMEVETPVLETTPGGADAKPFVTHHNALDLDLYLRISMGELWQKRLMVAGFEKTFEIGRQFRNEGISAEHLQDYTQMEFYWAYANYNDTMDLVERLYKHVIQQTFGTLQFTIKGFSVDFSQPWPHLDYVTAIKDQLGVDVLASNEAELAAKCRSLQIDPKGDVGKGRLMDLLWKHCRKQIAGPVFLVNHPVEVSPLAKRKADQPQLVERYQVIIAGSELGNGYTELNDPVDQAQRFEGQAAMRAAGDEEAQMHDFDFVEALEHGMPPTSGFGMSERLFSFLMDKSIRECVLFPLLRPKPSSSTATPSADASLAEIQPGINQAAALEWMKEEVKDENLRRHMLATEIIMQAWAKHFQAVSPEAWGIAGLLHDIDWEKTEPAQHSLIGADWLAKRGVHPLIVDAVREHNGDMHKLEPKTIMSKALFCMEQVTGLIMAATLVRPDKDVRGLQLASLKKKFKDKAFAKGVSRHNVQRCQELLGVPLDDALQLCLTAMQTAYDRY